MQGLLGGGAAAAAEAAPASSNSWYSDLYKKYKEGKFKTYARWLGVLNVFLMVGLTASLFVTLFGLANIFAIIFGIIIGILELPFCCTCFEMCKTIQKYLAIFEVYWLRALLYIGIGSLMIVLASTAGGVLGYLYGVLNIVDGLFYLIAHVRGETHEAADNTASGLGVNTTKLKTQVAAKAMGIV